MNTDEDKELCLFSATFRASVVLRVMFFPRNNPGYALSNSAVKCRRYLACLTMFTPFTS